MDKILWIVNIITILALLLSIIYTAGVVWRVEMKLDISYKFFLLAVIFIVSAEVADFFYGLDNAFFWTLLVKGLRMLFALSFLLGIIFMRNICRNIDGERKNEQNG